MLQKLHPPDCGLFDFKCLANLFCQADQNGFGEVSPKPQFFRQLVAHGDSQNNKASLVAFGSPHKQFAFSQLVVELDVVEALVDLRDLSQQGVGIDLGHGVFLKVVDLFMLFEKVVKIK